MLFRRCIGTASCGASLSVLSTATRHASSDNNNNNNNDNKQITDDSKSNEVGAKTDDSASAAGFKGWKRFDLSREGAAAVSTTPASTANVAHSAVSTPSNLHGVVEDRRAKEEARRRAASARLTDMFVESGHHAQWMQAQHQRSAQSSHYQEGLDSIRRVVAQDQAQQQQQGELEEGQPEGDIFGSAEADNSDAARPAHAALARQSSPTAQKPANLRNYAFDEDQDPTLSLAAEASATTMLTHTTPTDLLEQELLDDNFLYYPPPAALRDRSAVGDIRDETPPSDSAHADLHAEAAKERYVPGQQIIPPGFTRYRVDVQYQGSDFDGWYKSVQRARPRSATDKNDTSNSNHLMEGSSRHYARTVLEEALCVALDVASLTVVAAAIPETGVSVRRLTCHVDIPSEVELQPRTILQRATLWLHQRHMPLAILSCYPCKNQDFHARHSGVRRVYCYRILNRIAPPLFDAGLQWHVDRYLDVARMQRMARVMEGTHDYGYFADPKMANALRRAAAQGGGGPVVSAAYSAEHEALLSHGLPPGQAPAAPKVAIDRGLSQLERAAALPTFNEYGQRVVTYQAKPREYHKARTNLPTVRTIDKIDVVRQEDEVLIWFVGQSFLRHQIRNMVSVLKAGGHGLWDDQELQHAFQSGFEVSRKKFARERLPPAPVHGLTLWDVEYPTQHMSDFVPYVDAGPYEPHHVSLQH